jgi:TIR domain
MADIFFSYSREDERYVKALVNYAEKIGISCWWDNRIHAGTKYDDVISEQLHSARCIVVLWTRHSISSEWVKDEAEEGRKKGILVPIVLDSVDPPLGFRRIQSLDLAAWVNSGSPTELGKFSDAITRLIGAPGTQPLDTVTPPQARAGTSPIVPAKLVNDNRSARLHQRYSQREQEEYQRPFWIAWLVALSHMALLIPVGFGFGYLGFVISKFYEFNDDRTITTIFLLVFLGCTTFSSITYHRRK